MTGPDSKVIVDEHAIENEDNENLVEDDRSTLEGLDDPQFALPFDLYDVSLGVPVVVSPNGKLVCYGTRLPAGYVQISERDALGSFEVRPLRADEVEDLPDDEADELEVAALICAVGASNPDLSENYEGVIEALGYEMFSKASDLAHDAWNEATIGVPSFTAHPETGRPVCAPINPLHDAEADAALRVLLDREHAARLCDIIAAERAAGIDLTSIATYATSLGYSEVARYLAINAFCEAPSRGSGGCQVIALEYADAAAMLRSGWEPPT